MAFENPRLPRPLKWSRWNARRSSRRLAADAAVDAGIFLRLPGPRERRLRRPHYDQGAWLFRRSVRLRRRRVLRRLLPGRIAQQPDPGQGRCQALDRPHPAHLGHHFRADRLRLERLELLRHPFPARHRRGRLLPRHRAVPDLVVPVLLPFPHDGVLPIGQRDLPDHRAACFRLAAYPRRDARPARLAVVFLIEALPPIIMCFVIWAFLTDRPIDASGCGRSSAPGCKAASNSEQTQREAVHSYDLREALLNPRVWLLTLVYFGQNVSNYGLLIFLPQIVKSFGVSTQMTGYVSALPFVSRLVAMIYWGFHSDRTGNRIMHVASACLLCAGGLAACIFIGTAHPVMDDDGADPRDHGPAVDRAHLLAAAHCHAVRHRGGRRHRADQLRRQPRRLLRPYMFGMIKDATGGSDLCPSLAVGPLLTVIGGGARRPRPAARAIPSQQGGSGGVGRAQDVSRSSRRDGRRRDCWRTGERRAVRSGTGLLHADSVRRRHSPPADRSGTAVLPHYRRRSHAVCRAEQRCGSKQHACIG